MSLSPHSSLPLKPSVLDRLLDDDPGVSVEAPQTSPQQLRELRRSVSRDLENLLNTRWRCSVWPPDLEQLNDSLVNYGIPDFTSSGLNAAEEPDVLLRAIEAAIRHFEPRLQDVRIRPIERQNELDRTLQFRIDAILHVEPLSEPVRFDSTLQPATGQFLVQGGNR